MQGIELTRNILFIQTIFHICYICPELEIAKVESGISPELHGFTQSRKAATSRTGLPLDRRRGDSSPGTDYMCVSAQTYLRASRKLRLGTSITNNSTKLSGRSTPLSGKVKPHVSHSGQVQIIRTGNSLPVLPNANYSPTYCSRGRRSRRHARNALYAVRKVGLSSSRSL
jgi:hypothetical protein